MYFFSNNLLAARATRLVLLSKITNVYLRAMINFQVSMFALRQVELYHSSILSYLTTVGVFPDPRILQWHRFRRELKKCGVYMSSDFNMWFKQFVYRI